MVQENNKSGIFSEKVEALVKAAMEQASLMATTAAKEFTCDDFTKFVNHHRTLAAKASNGKIHINGEDFSDLQLASIGDSAKSHQSSWNLNFRKAADVFSRA